MTRNLPSIFLQLAMFAGALLALTCTDTSSVECPNGLICPAGFECAAAQDVCILNGCGNGEMETGETCDDGNIIDGDNCSADCESDETCGNDVRDEAAGEVCDDGNTADEDGCSADCLSNELCGNGTIDDAVGEVCDDSNTDSEDGCRGDCISDETCGNGEIDTEVGEACDDGNTLDGDSCSSDCTAGAGCGNGFTDAGEICDDGNQVDDDGCSANCLSDETCGNDTIDFAAGEVCDDANTDSGDGCRSDCHSNETCGNDELDADPGVDPDPEQCDDGGQVDGNGCSALCQLEVCGNGTLDDEFGEVCDDGNLSDGPCLGGSPPGSCAQDCSVSISATTRASDVVTVDTATLHGLSVGDDVTIVGVADSTFNGTFNVDSTPTTTSFTVADVGADGGSTGGIVLVQSDCASGFFCSDITGFCDGLDACSADCQSGQGCGDGNRDATEECDDADDEYSNDCIVGATGEPIRCELARCGDGFIHDLESGIEECDGDGAGDGDPTTDCDSDCTFAECGDAVVNPLHLGEVSLVLEQCDDGGQTAFCDDDCTIAVCGDGTFNDDTTDEECDDAGNSTTCNADCTLSSCGDGFFNAVDGEFCDDGGTADGDGCSSLCVVEPHVLGVVRVGTGTGTVTSTDTRINCGSACSDQYIDGASVTLNAAPTGVSYFAGWTGDGTGDPRVVTMTANRGVAAIFDLNRLTVARDGTGTGTVTATGIDCGGAGDCFEDYAFNAPITLTAVPTAATSDPPTWSGPGTGACVSPGNTCVVTMASARTVTATFPIKTPLLTVTKLGTGASTSTVTSSPGSIDCGTTCTENFADGTVVGLFANAGTGFAFTGWSGTGATACSLPTPTCFVTMDDPKTATAAFADTAKPVTTISAPSGAALFTTAATVALAGTATDNVGVSTVTWVNANGGSFGSSSTFVGSNWTVASVPLLAGANQITVTSTDAAGNTGTAVVTVTRDNTNPTVSITAPSGSGTFITSATSVALGGVASDNVNVASVAWTCIGAGCGSANGSATGTSTWSVPTFALNAGVATITVTATDNAGLTGSAVIVVTRDNTVPTVAITSPTSGGAFTTTASSITLGGTAADTGGGAVLAVSWTCATCTPLSGPATGTTVWSAASIGIAAGPNTINVISTDTAGNNSVASTIIVTRDNANPTVSITAPNGGADVTVATTTLTTLAGTAGDTGGTLASVTWTNAANAASGTATGTATWSVPSVALVAGANVITVTATDTAGNVGTDNITVTRDSTAPVVTITGPTAADTFITNATPLTTLAGTASDASGITQVAWACTGACSSNATATGTTSWSVPGPGGIVLGLGTNTITVTATDGAGNTSQDVLTVTLDTTAPTGAITSPNGGSNFTTRNAATGLGGTAADANGVASVAWTCTAGCTGTAVPATGTTAWSVPPITLVAGLNTISVSATDTAGNSAVIDTIDVTRDNTGPTVTITTNGGANFTTTTTPMTTLAGTAADTAGVASVSWTNAANATSGAGTGTTNWTVASITLVAGANVITVTGTDGVGNTSTDVITVTHDAAAPAVTIQAPTSSATLVTSSATLSGTLALGGAASDDVGVASVAWVNDNSVLDTSGAATGTTAWSVASITLEAGSNAITVTATDVAARTGTDVLTVTRDNTAPAVAITTPTSSPTATVTTSPVVLGGTVTDAVGVASVTYFNAANSTTGSAGTVGGGNWSNMSVTLVPGDNPIIVTAMDTAGNTSFDVITVTRNVNVTIVRSGNAGDEALNTVTATGISCPADCSGTYPIGDVSFTATAGAANTSFTGWSGTGVSCGSSNPCVVNLTDDVTITATFSHNPKLLTVVKAGTGTGTVTGVSAPSQAEINCGSTCALNYSHQTDVTLTAVPDLNQTFVGWSGEGCSGTGTCDVEMNQARTVTATFEPFQSLTVTTSGTGAGAGSVVSSPGGVTAGGAACTFPGTCFYAFNSVPVVTASTTLPDTFDGWTGDCVGATCSPTMSTALTADAAFTDL